ncbi:hypothetical protein [Kribbella sp. NPDC004536]|uniref:hypothetical protein n=1 Tax=Kribbella sp. NPDC004536 TaxID=3364106 RepID=UPI0036884AEB
MTNPPPDPTTPGYPQPPAPDHPYASAGGYPQQPSAGHPYGSGGGYPQQPSPGHPYGSGGGYAQQPAPGYRQAPGSGYAQQPAGSGYPQHLWPEHAQPHGAVPPSAPRAKGSAAMGILALLLAIAGLVTPFLPFSNLIDRFPVRQYLAFPFAIPALALAITTLATNRRAKPAAAIGMMIAFLALIVGAIMIYNYDIRP